LGPQSKFVKIEVPAAFSPGNLLVARGITASPITLDGLGHVTG
jgi:hypothetical protein